MTSNLSDSQKAEAALAGYYDSRVERTGRSTDDLVRNDRCRHAQKENARKRDLMLKSIIVTTIFSRGGSELDCIEALVKQNDELMKQLTEQAMCGPRTIIVSTEELERLKQNI